MGDKSGIQWTDATWNPVVGCDLESPGCKNCYAMKMAGRLEAMGQKRYAGLTQVVNGHRVWTGEVRTLPEVLELPLRWRKGRLIFVNSMSDLFHPEVPFEFIDRVFAVMALAPQHTFQVLTKRPERMAEYLGGLEADPHALPNRFGEATEPFMTEKMVDYFDHDHVGFPEFWPLPNVWLGTSVEDQKRADERIPHLLRCLAAVRFLSCEPLLSPVELREHWLYFGFPSHITADGRAMGGRAASTG